MQRPVFLPTTYYPGGTTAYLKMRVRRLRWLVAVQWVVIAALAGYLYFHA